MEKFSKTYIQKINYLSCKLINFKLLKNCSNIVSETTTPLIPIRPENLFTSTVDLNNRYHHSSPNGYNNSQVNSLFFFSPEIDSKNIFQLCFPVSPKKEVK